MAEVQEGNHKNRARARFSEKVFSIISMFGGAST
jgi:hypothetical protein